MLRDIDTISPPARRQRWMEALAKADLQALESAMLPYRGEAFTWLRRPETGLAMVRARIGGTGDRFNLGETTVTRCVLRLACGSTGVAYVQGRSHRKCELAALADALLQDPARHDSVFREVVEPALREQEAEAARIQRRAQATRVEFLTVAREAGA